MSDADDILRRLVEWADRPGKKPLDDFIGEAIAYLSREKVSEGQRSEPAPVMAEGWVDFVQRVDGSWVFCDGGDFRGNLPVPAHLLNPPTVEGEAVEEG